MIIQIVYMTAQARYGVDRPRGADINRYKAASDRLKGADINRYKVPCDRPKGADINRYKRVYINKGIYKLNLTDQKVQI